MSNTAAIKLLLQQNEANALTPELKNTLIYSMFDSCYTLREFLEKAKELENLYDDTQLKAFYQKFLNNKRIGVADINTFIRYHIESILKFKPMKNILSKDIF